MTTSNEAYPLDVTITDRVNVAGERVLLGDVATFQPALDNRVQKLRLIELASAPAPGKSMTFSSRLLIHRIDQAAGHMKDVKFRVPENLLVTRESQIINAEELKRIFREHVLKNTGQPVESIVFEKIRVPGPVLLPQGQIRWESKSKKGRELVGDISVVVAFWVDETLTRKIPLLGRVKVRQAVLKTAREISAGEMIQAGDLVISVEHNLQLKKDVLRQPEDVVGKRAAYRLSAGQVVTRKMIEEPILVEKGNRVIIRGENRYIKVTAIGRVLEDGKSGDQVAVINVRSGKKIFAMVTGQGEVVVNF
jgi:flagella basal body P-ring formation protein FlgA